MKVGTQKRYSIRIATTLLFSSLIGGVTGWMLIENYKFIDALYMSIITISTVGFGTIGELSSPGKIFAIIYILLNLGVLAYFVGVFSDYIIEGRLKNIVNKFILNSSANKLKDHVIVCGIGRNGYNACKELLQNNVPYISIDINEKIFLNPTKTQYYQNYIVGDATQDEVLELAGISRAKAIIACMASDSDNVFVTLTARELRPDIFIIAKASHSTSVPKLERAGANNVVLPDKIGGHYMASLVTKPTVIEFLEKINGIGIESKFAIQEFDVKSLKKEYHNKRIRDLAVRKISGVTILAFKENGEFRFNPGPDEIMRIEDQIIVFGEKPEMRIFENHFLS